MKVRLTYANVVSTIALFAVLADGTAVALPGKKTVQANDLKRNAVKAVAIAKKAVRSAEIKDGTIVGADVADQGLGYEDLGSNSVIARIRSTAPVQIDDGGEASPVAIPLTANSWTQGANETNVLFGEITSTEPPVCTNGFVDIQYFLGGEMVLEESYSDDPGTTATEPLPAHGRWSSSREPTLPGRLSCGSGTTATTRANYTIERLALNVVAIR